MCICLSGDLFHVSVLFLYCIYAQVCERYKRFLGLEKEDTQDRSWCRQHTRVDDPTKDFLKRRKSGRNRRVMQGGICVDSN